MTSLSEGYRSRYEECPPEDRDDYVANFIKGIGIAVNGSHEDAVAMLRHHVAAERHGRLVGLPSRLRALADYHQGRGGLPPEELRVLADEIEGYL